MGRVRYVKITEKTCMLLRVMAYEGGRVLNIPKTVSNLKVISLSDTFFSNLPNIETILFPKTLVNYGNKNVPVFPSSVAAINVDDDNPVFSSIDGVLFNKDQHKLLYYPAEKKEEEYIVPSSVVSIGHNAFSHNKYLKKISFGKNLRSISNVKFLATQTTTEKLNIFPKSLEKISFYDNNEEYYTDNGILFKKSKNQLVYFPNIQNVTSYTIPAFVKNIMPSAFDNTTYLKELFIYCNKTFNIIPGTFKNNTSLDKIYLYNTSTIPKALQNIKAMVLFKYIEPSADNLEKTNTTPAIVEKAITDACIDKDILTLPESSVSISVSAQKASQVSKIIFPYNLKKIPLSFLIRFPNVTIIESTNNGTLFVKDNLLIDRQSSTILYCPPKDSRKILYIDSSIKAIGNNCFYNNKNLESVLIDSENLLIDSEAFHNCKALKEIYFNCSIKKAGVRQLSGVKNDVEIYL